MPLPKALKLHETREAILLALAADVEGLTTDLAHMSERVGEHSRHLDVPYERLTSTQERQELRNEQEGHTEALREHEARFRDIANELARLQREISRTRGQPERLTAEEYEFSDRLGYEPPKGDGWFYVTLYTVDYPDPDTRQKQRAYTRWARRCTTDPEY